MDIGQKVAYFTLKPNINGKPEQMHKLSHYNHYASVFLPSAEARVRSGVFYCTAPGWLLHLTTKIAMGSENRIVAIHLSSPD